MPASQRHKMEQLSAIHFIRGEKKRAPRENLQRNPPTTWPVHSCSRKLSREEKKHGPRENLRRNPRTTRPCTHAAGNCPAYGKKTYVKCKTEYHLAKVWQSTSKQDSKKSTPWRKKPGKHHQVNLLQQDQPPDELSNYKSILTLVAPKRDKIQYVASFLMSASKDEKAVSTKFYVDTGASCSSLTLRDHKRITSKIPDQSDTKRKLYYQSLIHPGGRTRLDTAHLTSWLRKSFRNCWACAYVSTLRPINFNQEHLIQVGPSNYPPPLNQEQVPHEYHDVFSGLGKLPGTYHINMDPTAKAVKKNPTCTNSS